MVVFLQVVLFVPDELVFKVEPVLVLQLEHVLLIVLLLVEIEPSDIIQIVFGDL